jgi:predicted DNA-binding transcriptional regulator AlpA
MRAISEDERETNDEAPAARSLERRGTGLPKRVPTRRRRRDNDSETPRRGRPNVNVSTRPVGWPTSSVAGLVTNPSMASEVPTHRIPALVAELASEQATLSALQGMLTARLLASQDTPVTAESADRLLTAEQVAAILGVTKRWVERRARRLPFARRLSAHAVRYSESGLRRWMSNRQMRTS